MKTLELTPSETIVMKCIWDADHEMSLAEILENANTRFGKEWKSQTVSTFLAKLVQKQFIKMKRNGRMITYEILVSEKEYKTGQAREFVSFWNKGSIRQFLAAFYDEKPATKEELEELRRAIDELDE